MNKKEKQIKISLGKRIGINLLAIIAILFGLLTITPIGSASQNCPSIDEKYAQLGGNTGFLGGPISGEIVTSDGIGHYRNYEHGTIYWTDTRCAHELHGPILIKYLSKDYRDWSNMGYPTSDVVNSRDNGNYADFEGGVILYKDRTGAHALTNGAILDYYTSKGRENSSFGYPMTDIMLSNDMQYDTVYFEKRIIYAGSSPSNPIGPFDEYYQKEEPGFNCVTAGTFSGCNIAFYPPPVVTHWKIPNQDIDVYRIDGPVVWGPPLAPQAKQIYPDIKLKPGDNVTLSAGGCVQTSNGILSGSTWHRYVESYSTDNNYFGKVQIDGAIPEIALDQGVLNKPTPIGVSDSGTNDFWLNYIDDGKSGDSDNSYGYHDNGPGGQCTDVGPAWVVVTVDHNRTLPLPPPKPFDIVQNNSSNRKFDDNFILLNPKWGSEVTNNEHPIMSGDLTKEENWATLTDQKPQFDLHPTWRGSLLHCDQVDTPSLRTIGGHYNWIPVTYEGNIIWDGKTSPWGDDDYGFFEAQNDSLTLNNAVSQVDAYGPRAVHLEFDSDETIDHFRTYWWQNVLRDYVDNRGDQFVRNIINGRYAIVTGLAGIDAAHGCCTELHPVWAMAINLTSSPIYPDDEYWAMFVRNWGDEGWCSQDQHYLNLNSDTYSFRLPWRQGATDVDVVWGDNDGLLNTYFLSHDIPNPIEIDKAVNEGVLLKFKMTPPHEDGSRINGQLHLHWIYPQIPSTSQSSQNKNIQIQSVKTQLSIQPNQNIDQQPIKEVEDYFNILFSQLTPQQQNILLSNLPEKNNSKDEVVSQPIKAMMVPHLQVLLPGQDVKMPTVTSEYDNEKANRDNQKLNAWIATFGSVDAFNIAIASLEGEDSVSRTIENQILHTGDSTNVTVIMKTNISQPLSLNETLPPGWTLTRISDDADSFSNNVWNWLNADTNSEKIVVYRLNVPPDADAKTYYINGNFTDHTEIWKPVSGQNTIKVVAEIHGKKWEDLNANSKQDSFESNLLGWQINLAGKNTIENLDVSESTVTDYNGNFNFTNLSAGNYVLSETLKSGWIQTTPITGNYAVTITSGAIITGQDFGNFHKGDITGGGWISIAGDPNATFGITGKYQNGSNTPQGNLEYQDHNASLNIKSINITSVASTLDKKKGDITGYATVNGAGSYPFEAYVEDNGEPGKDVDVFNISLSTYPYTNGAKLSGGNIQIHG